MSERRVAGLRSDLRARHTTRSPLSAADEQPREHAIGWSIDRRIAGWPIRRRYHRLAPDPASRRQAGDALIWFRQASRPANPPAGACAESLPSRATARRHLELAIGMSATAPIADGTRLTPEQDARNTCWKARRQGRRGRRRFRRARSAAEHPRRANPFRPPISRIRQRIGRPAILLQVAPAQSPEACARTSTWLPVFALRAKTTSG